MSTSKLETGSLTLLFRQLVRTAMAAQQVESSEITEFYLVQLLEGPKGERLVRFAYATDGTARRGPVTFRARDLEKLRAGLKEHPELAAALGLG